MKERKRKPLVKYDPSSDVLYIATREGVEEEFTEVAPGVNVELDRKGHGQIPIRCFDHQVVVHHRMFSTTIPSEGARASGPSAVRSDALERRAAAT